MPSPSRDARTPAPPDTPSLETLREKIAGHRSGLGRLRSLHPGWRLGALVLLAAALVGAQLLGPRADLAAYPGVRMALALIALSLVALLGWVAALRPLQRPALGSAARWALLLGLVLVPVGLALAPEAHTAHPASAEGTGSELVPRAVACFLYGGLFGLPLVVASVLVDRTGGRRALVWLVSFTAAAVVGNLALQLHCALTHPAHLLAGHASIGLAALLIALATAETRNRFSGRGTSRDRDGGG